MNRFIPRLETLEARDLPSAFGLPGLEQGNLSLPGNGTAFQIGSSLEIVATQSAVSSTFILGGYQGDVAVAVNGAPFQFFAGVRDIQVLSEGVNNTVFLAVPSAPHVPLNVNVAFLGLTNNLFEHLAQGGAPVTVSASPSPTVLPF